MKASRKARLLGFFLPLAGLLLIMPPMVHIFGTPSTIFGVPSIIAFLFAVWFGLIGAAYLLQRTLEDEETAKPVTTSVLASESTRTSETEQ